MFTRYGNPQFTLFSFVVPALGVGLAALCFWLLRGVSPLAAFALGGLLGLLSLIWMAFCLNFFRDPERAIPGDSFTIVSPADGTVTDIGLREDPELFKRAVPSIGIFLSVFDVHVNRAPLDGTVDYLRHQDGQYLDARDPRCSTLNESQNIGLRTNLGPRCLMRQITGLIARRIVCPLKLGDSLARGQRFGMIKFGSRTELYLDPAFDVTWSVKVGDKVLGGATALGVVKVRANQPSPDRVEAGTA